MWCRLGVREREGRGVGIGWTYMVMKMQRRHGRIASSTLRFSHALSTLPPPARGLFVWALGGVGSGLLLLRRRRFRPLSTPGLHSAPAPITHSSATQNPISPSLSTRMPDQHAASSSFPPTCIRSPMNNPMPMRPLQQQRLVLLLHVRLLVPGVEAVSPVGHHVRQRCPRAVVLEVQVACGRLTPVQRRQDEGPGGETVAHPGDIMKSSHMQAIDMSITLGRTPT
jgi:hypothetical protein